MSELTSTAPFTSSEGEAVVQGAPLLSDAVVDELCWGLWVFLGEGGEGDQQDRQG